ncbi:hypothetical protein E8E12_001290 [Didymella heteroderae]|uniref:Calcineurin-like phosphoesterase domain-containing protein n=1 Tax=Didymella heteroderae TaxID=1769908 RepID=A0A9P5BXY3_9PLEO|nr:hypothetical protein E8E12_001290 [Didymella heteroderae]
MALFAPTFQIISDLHLETPVAAPQYAAFKLSVMSDDVLLLGDIGLTTDNRLLVWLRKLLEDNPSCRVFYVMGNHEPYRSTYEAAVRTLRGFEEEAKDIYGGRFNFLCRNRYDIGDVTILGCTLWSNIDPFQASEIASRSTDLEEKYGIRDWTLERHQEEHMKDLAWLNDQVRSLQDETHRQIIVATHHSPTIDPRATDPAQRGDAMSSNFATDLSTELCWTSPQVKLWAFGHTHYNCSYRDKETGKLVIANQKGYAGLRAPRRKRKVKTKVVKATKEGWSVVEQANADETVGENDALSQHGSQTAGSTSVHDAEERPFKSSVFQRVARRLRRRS